MLTRFVRIIAGVFVVLAAGVGLLFLLLSPVDREYALRLARYGESDVQDYRVFPERVIQPAAQPILLKSDPHPEWFGRITYTRDGKPETAGMDELMERVKTQALIVIQDGRIVYEKYYNGYQRDSIVTSFSSAKSFNSTLIGMAIEEGRIGGVNDRVVQYLPELKGRGLDAMTIRDLLLMSSGIEYHEDENMFPGLGAPFSDDAKTYYYPDLRRLVFQTVKGGPEPIGKYFHYNNYHPILEGMILERVTGMHAARYLQEKLWIPLGAEYPASWSLDSQAASFEKMESGINGRAIDFAKLGLLFLQEGNWEGKQLLSAAWVREATAPDPADEREWLYWSAYQKDGGYYKYHWWGKVRPDGHYDYTAAGNFGQYIYVCPQKHLVIARYGESETGVDSFHEVLYSMEKMVP